MLQVAENSNLEVELPRAPTAARVARGALRRWCGDSVDREMLVDAVLLASELTTNALLHGDGQITLRARLDEDHLLVELTDEGSGFERALQRSDFWRIGGWGLGIVDDVASRWGVHEGTHVWFELDTHARRLVKADC